MYVHELVGFFVLPAMLLCVCVLSFLLRLADAELYLCPSHSLTSIIESRPLLTRKQNLDGEEIELPIPPSLTDAPDHTIVMRKILHFLFVCSKFDFT